MSKLYVIVCDSDEGSTTSTEVVCVSAASEKSVNATCDAANAILREGDDARQAFYETAVSGALADVLRPFGERLAKLVGARFEPSFYRESMRAVLTDWRPR